MEWSSAEPTDATPPAVHQFVERTDIVSWGRVVREPQRVARPQFRDQLPRLLCDPSWNSKLPVGLRRSYGDSCLNGQGALIDATGLDRVIAFDPKTGRLKAEAGMSLSEALKLIVPHGWFLPTTPGTRFVTLAGAVANDVHGKNHHRAATFGANATALGILRSDGRRIAMAPDLERELFSATIGGLGLTGVIEWVEIQLAPIPNAYLEVEIIPFDGLDAFWPVAEESVGTYEHTVAWVDCTLRAGRGVFTRANWAPGGGLDTHDDGAFKTVPADLPGFALNRLFVAGFNELYYTLHRLKNKRVRQHYSRYFYPLDAVLNWNSTVWLARHAAVPVRGILRERARSRAAPHRGDRPLRAGLVPRRAQDVRG